MVLTIFWYQWVRRLHLTAAGEYFVPVRPLYRGAVWTHPVLRAASLREPLSAWHRFSAEPDGIRRVGTCSHNVWPAVAIKIRECQPIHGALAVIPTDFVKTARAGVEVHRPRCLHIAHHDIRPAISIEIGNRQCVRRPRRPRKPLRFAKLPYSTVVDHKSRLFLFIDEREIQP